MRGYYSYVDDVAGARTAIVKDIGFHFLDDGYGVSGGFKFIKSEGVLGVEIRLQPVSPNHTRPEDLQQKIEKLIPKHFAIEGGWAPVVVSFLLPIYDRS